ncbi:polycystic kidney disease 2-like 1 [Stylonychia lemnae]|uniref:Polycystic kidney disease 2-like 1 n=1 Tax=Stylonychia lemnae TaxID=5949 RepID=A0A077ZY08_STYLE|nr:polycystic kidney disease 2-like 1 [Stylonychia lemnae]|eukprot:CDW74117.1 polycystic kidney disease 2-like 1 [Stylonychia lemnae]
MDQSYSEPTSPLHQSMTLRKLKQESENSKNIERQENKLLNVVGSLKQNIKGPLGSGAEQNSREMSKKSKTDIFKPKQQYDEVQQNKDKLLGNLNKLNSNPLEIVNLNPLAQGTNNRISFMGLGKSKVLAKGLKERLLKQMQEQLNQNTERSNDQSVSNQTSITPRQNSNFPHQQSNSDNSQELLQTEDEKAKLKNIMSLFTKQTENDKQNPLTLRRGTSTGRQDNQAQLTSQSKANPLDSSRILGTVVRIPKNNSKTSMIDIFWRANSKQNKKNQGKRYNYLLKLIQAELEKAENDKKKEELDVSIELPDDKEEIDELLENRDQSEEGTLFQLIFFAFFIAFFILEIRLDSSTGMGRLIGTNIFDTYLNATSRNTVMNVSNEAELQQSIYFLIDVLYTDELYNPNEFLELHSYNHQQATDDVANDDTTSDTQSTNNNPPLYVVMIQKYNYFAGMRITSQYANLDQTNEDFQEVTPLRRSNFYSDPMSTYGNFNKTNPPFTYSGEGGFNDKGGFVMFFKGNETRNQSMNQFTEMIQNGWFKQIIIKMLLFSGFFIMMMILFFKTLFITVNAIKLFFVRKSFDLAWYTYIDVIVVGLCVTQATYWFSIFMNQRDQFYLPFKDEGDFNKWSLFALNMKIFFVLILGMSAMCVSIGFFGQHEERFMNANASIMTLFQMMFGEVEFQKINAANSFLAPIFFILFILAFFYIIINFFSAIIMRTYDNMRQRKQLVTEAMAEIVAQEANQHKEIWLNLICCRIKQPKQLAEDDEDNDEENRNLNSNNNVDTDSEVNNPSLSAKIQYNLNQVRKLLSGQNQLKTREQFEEELNRTKIAILKRKRLEKIKRKQQFTNPTDVESFIKLKESVIYSIFIIVYVTMLLYQTNNKTSQQASSPIRNLLFFKKFEQHKKYQDMGLKGSMIGFQQISNPDDIFDFVGEIIFPFVYANDTIMQQSNLGVSESYIRFTFRFINNTKNEDQKTNSVFPGKLKTYELGKSKPNSDEIQIPVFTTKNQYIDMVYNNNRQPTETFMGNGGYPILLSNDTEDGGTLFDMLYEEDWMYYGLSQLVVDYVVYNPNYQKFIYNYILFEIDGSGFVKPYSASSTLYLNHWVSANSFVILLELFYLAFTLYYFLKLVSAFKQTWLEVGLEIDIKYKTPKNASKCYNIVIWFQITIKNNISEADFKSHLIERASGLSFLQDDYRLLAHFNIFITFMRILQFFTFSKKLSTFSEIIASAWYDIIFFVLMFAVVRLLTQLSPYQILFGYAVAGYSLFGSSVFDFRTIFMSGFRLFRMIFIDLNYTELYQTDSVIFKIALFNMFIAIIVAHYNEFRRLSIEEENVSFFQVIALILKNNLFKGNNENGKCKKYCKCINQEKLQLWLFGSGEKNKIGDSKVQNNLDEEKVNQEKEASNIGQILRRFSKPEYKDNQLSYGMKTYFADRILGSGTNLMNGQQDEQMQQRQVKNISIFKRIEEIGYNSHDMLNSNLWLYFLEESLLKLSQSNISLYDLQSENTIFTESFESINPDQMSSFIKEFLSIERSNFNERKKFILKRTRNNIKAKYEIWKSLDIEKMIRFIHSHVSDPGIKLIRILNGLADADTDWNTQVFSMKFNRVTKFQLELWNYVFDVNEKYLLWFEHFNAQERQLKRQKKIAQGKTQVNVNLTPTEIQKIRDQIYNSKTMLYIWNQLKKRHFQLPEKQKHKRGAQADQEAGQSKQKRKSHTLSRKDYVDMLKSMFRLMIGGLSNDRLKMIQRMQQKEGQKQKFEIYKKLKDEIFDESEYRLSLWLPLSRQEKLDMILHQRVEEEMEIMIFMLDEELEHTKSIKSNQEVDVEIERAFDQQIFSKYILFAKLMATRKSVEMCQLRLNTINDEDESLIQYAGYLHQKLKDCESILLQLKQELAKKQKANEKLEKERDLRILENQRRKHHHQKFDSKDKGSEFSRSMYRKRQSLRRLGTRSIKSRGFSSKKGDNKKFSDAINDLMEESSSLETDSQVEDSSIGEDDIDYDGDGLYDEEEVHKRSQDSQIYEETSEHQHDDQYSSFDVRQSRNSKMEQTFSHPLVESYWSDLFSSGERLGFTAYNLVSSYLNFILSQTFNTNNSQAFINQYFVQTGTVNAVQKLSNQGLNVKLSTQEWAYLIFAVLLTAFTTTDTGLSYFGMVANIFYSYIYLRDPNSYNSSNKFDAYLPKILLGFKQYTSGSMYAMIGFLAAASISALFMNVPILIILIAIQLLPRFLYHYIVGQIAANFALLYAVEQLI